MFKLFLLWYSQKTQQQFNTITEIESERNKTGRRQVLLLLSLPLPTNQLIPPPPLSLGLI
jgi:hypothetical protein